MSLTHRCVRECPFMTVATSVVVVYAEKGKAEKRRRQRARDTAEEIR